MNDQEVLHITYVHCDVCEVDVPEQDLEEHNETHDYYDVINGE